MKIYIACFVLLTTLQCYSQNLKLNWHKHIQGLGESNVRAQKLTIDKDGNILMSIRFKDSVYCFEKKYYSLGRYYNALLVTKVDKEGNYLWDVSLKSYTSINEITGLDTDNNGNIYVTGLTGPDTMRVNDSLIAYDLSNPINGFLICLDSEGTIKWTKAYQGTRDFFRFEPTDLVFDKQSGGIIVAGKSFGKGQIGDIQIDNGVGFHTVLLKHGPDGNFSNAYIIADNGDYDSDIALDKDGNILMATSFDTKITLQDQEFTTLNDLSDAILIKFDPDCQLLWARQGGGFLYDYGIKCAVDDEGNCYLLAQSDNDDEITYADSVWSSEYFNNAVVAKYNTNGDMQWANLSGGIIGKDLLISDSGVYLAGTLSSYFYIFFINNSGLRQYYESRKASEVVKDIQIAISNSNIITLGAFSMTLVLGDDVTLDTENFHSDIYDGFLASYREIPSSVFDLHVPIDITIYPNPTTQEIYLQLGGSDHVPDQIFIYNAIGDLVRISPSNNSWNTHETIKIGIEGLKAGIYFIVVRSGENRNTFKFIKR